MNRGHSRADTILRSTSHKVNRAPRSGANGSVNILLVGSRKKCARYALALRGLAEKLLVVPSAAAALELLRTTEVAVVLADAHVLARNGRDLARAIHGRLGLVDTAVVLAFDSAPFALDPDARHDGALDFIVEPIAPALLCARVRTLVELFHQARELERLAEERRALLHRHEQELQQIAHAVAHDLE